MPLLRRITTHVTSRLDWMLTQVENQEALVDSAIQNVRRAAARARVQLARVEQDGRRLRARHDELAAAEDQWRDRARRCAEADESRALECLRRSRRARRERSEVGRRLEEHTQAERQLVADVEKVESRLASLREQRNLLRTRESRAEALGTVREAATTPGADLDEVFDRWEVRILERELDGEYASPGDSLEAEFEEAEQDAELRDELAALLADPGDPSPADSPTENEEGAR